jgi:hypothetical protein
MSTQQISSEGMAYVGRRPCGCCEMAVADIREHPRDTAKEVAKAVRRGLSVERVTNDWVRRESVWSCDVCTPKSSKKKKTGGEA